MRRDMPSELTIPVGHVARTKIHAVGWRVAWGILAGGWMVDGQGLRPHVSLEIRGK